MLPTWVHGFRDHQLVAAREVLDAFERFDEHEVEGEPSVVFMQAPTGSGKTLIAEMVRRVQSWRGLYTCDGKELQAQFVGDFPDARVLMGRANYTTQNGPPWVSCADCTRMPRQPESCAWCATTSDCPYDRAKGAALGARLACTNIHYLLHEGNYVGSIVGLADSQEQRDLIVVDEADVLEDVLMGFVELAITSRTTEPLGLTVPPPKTRKTTISRWLTEEFSVKAFEHGKVLEIAGRRERDVRVMRAGRRYIQVSMRAAEVAAQLDSEWVRDDVSEDKLVLKPVHVGRYAQETLWHLGKRWLCMSATILSPEVMAESLGLKDHQWRFVDVPSTFDVERRKVWVTPVASMTRAEEDISTPVMCSAVAEVCKVHEGENILVHTVSYRLAQTMTYRLRSAGIKGVHSYSSAQERSRVIEDFKVMGGVLVASSAERGLDLPDDLCRVIVIAKVPFPYLGDRQVNARMHSEGGQVWYAMKAARAAVQMTGRGMRHETDRCITYILDTQFTVNLMRNWRSLFPKWWLESTQIARFNTALAARGGLPRRRR